MIDAGTCGPRVMSFERGNHLRVHGAPWATVATTVAHPPLTPRNTSNHKRSRETGASLENRFRG